jgi:lipopolysaccharide/colanic/teichoic acid biosynthesis glycosyltransferase
MKIIVTGATGFIGQKLVPYLKEANVELLLVGRNTEKLKTLFPNEKVTCYEDLEENSSGYDTLVHLAIMNNNKLNSINDFREVNVILLKDMLNIARSTGIKTFINPTTLHISQINVKSKYAQTKLEAENLLSQSSGINIINLRLPAVYGNTYSGKLAILLKLPPFFRPFAFQCLASLRPTVNVKLVISEILKSAQVGISREYIVSDKQNGNQVYKTIKRVVDVTFALFVIIVLWWILILSWAAVKLSSPGPGIFKQIRVGKNGIPFVCYKFRTMKKGTKEDGTHMISSDSVTTVGRFLRKMKIDELPQVWNILKNDISLVGPRPCLTSQQKLIDARTKLGVIKDIGGITGWSQIQNVDMSDPDQLAHLDAEYLLLRTVPFDLKIIFLTILGHGQGDKIK